MKKKLLLTYLLLFAFTVTQGSDKTSKIKKEILSKNNNAKKNADESETPINAVLEKFIYFYNNSDSYYSLEDLINIICTKCLCEKLTSEEQVEIKHRLFTLNPEEFYNYIINNNEEVKNIFTQELYNITSKIDKKAFIDAYNVKLAIAYLLYAIFHTNAPGYDYPYSYLKDPKTTLKKLLIIVKNFLIDYKEIITNEINKESQLTKSTVEAMFKETNEFFTYYINKPCSGMGQYLIFLKKVNDIYGKFFTLIFSSKQQDKNKQMGGGVASALKAPMYARHMALCFAEEK